MNPDDNPPLITPPEPSKTPFTDLSDEDKIVVAKKLLARDAAKVSVRGWEMARLTPAGEWEPVVRYRDTRRDMAACKAAVTHANNFHPNTLYQMRVIVSAAVPEPPQPQTMTADEDAPAFSPTVNCPKCRAPMTISDDAVTCDECGEQYSAGDAGPSDLAPQTPSEGANNA